MAAQCRRSLGGRAEGDDDEVAATNPGIPSEEDNSHQDLQIADWAEHQLGNQHSPVPRAVRVCRPDDDGGGKMRQDAG